MSEYYSETDPRNVEPHFSKHMNAMTTECLESKGDIAIELAVRDRKIERLRGMLAQCPLHINGNIDEWRQFLEPGRYSETAQQAAKQRIAEGEALLREIAEALGDVPEPG